MDCNLESNITCGERRDYFLCRRRSMPGARGTIHHREAVARLYADGRIGDRRRCATVGGERATEPFGFGTQGCSALVVTSAAACPLRGWPCTCACESVAGGRHGS